MGDIKKANTKFKFSMVKPMDLLISNRIALAAK
jgi:hypothetical protein